MAALSVVASGGVVFATPGVAHAAAPVYRGQMQAVSVAQSQAALAAGVMGPFVLDAGLARVTQATLTADKSSIQRGQSIVLTGRITAGAAQTAARDLPVRLESSTGGEWTVVGHALANVEGQVSFAVKPTATTKYRLTFAGLRTFGPSVSAEQAVTVKVPVPVVPRSSSSGGTSGGGGGAIGANGRTPSATAQAFLDAAWAHAGKPYSYGSAGPDAFDCSGLVKYVAAQFGLSLPHNANSQKSYGTPVSAADAAPGDLIFFLDGGYAYHVGIYAGGNKMFDAPNSRSTVGLHTIWGSNVTFRRIF